MFWISYASSDLRNFPRECLSVFRTTSKLKSLSRALTLSEFQFLTRLLLWYCSEREVIALPELGAPGRSFQRSHRRRSDPGDRRGVWPGGSALRIATATSFNLRLARN